MSLPQKILLGHRKIFWLIHGVGETDKRVPLPSCCKRAMIDYLYSRHRVTDTRTASARAAEAAARDVEDASARQLECVFNEAIQNRQSARDDEATDDNPGLLTSKCGSSSCARI